MGFFKSESLTIEEEEILEKRKKELKSNLKSLGGEQEEILNKFKAIKRKALSKTGRNINYNFLVEKDRNEFLSLLDDMYSYVKNSEKKYKNSSQFITGVNTVVDWFTGTKFENEVKKPIEDYIDSVVKEHVKIEGISKDNKVERTNRAAKLTKLMITDMGVVQNKVKKYIQYRYGKNNKDLKAENQINIQEYEKVFLKILFSIAGVRSAGANLSTNLDTGIFERLVTNTIRYIKKEYGVASKMY